MEKFIKKEINNPIFGYDIEKNYTYSNNGIKNGETKVIRRKKKCEITLKDLTRRQ